MIIRSVMSIVLTMPTLSSMSILTMSFLQKWQLNLLILSHFELTLTFETVKEYSFLQKNEENPEEVKTMKYLSVRNLVRFASCVHNDYQTWVRTFPGLVHSYTNCCFTTEFWQFCGILELFDHSLKWTCSTCCICSEYFFGRRISFSDPLRVRECWTCMMVWCSVFLQSYFISLLIFFSYIYNLTPLFSTFCLFR